MVSRPDQFPASCYRMIDFELDLLPCFWIV